MRRIYLHGAIGKKYGKFFDLEVETAGEAIRAIAANFPEFLNDIRAGAWHIVRGKTIKNGLSLGEDELRAFKLGNAPLHILAYVAGSKNAGGLKMIIGAAVIGAAVVFSGGTLAAPLTGLLTAGGSLTVYGNMAMIGVAMMVSGASSLLTPDQTTNEDSSKSSSYTMAGPGNAYAQGSPIPLVYGEVITGGVMISGGIDVERVAATGGGSGIVSGGKK